MSESPIFDGHSLTGGSGNRRDRIAPARPCSDSRHLSIFGKLVRSAGITLAIVAAATGWQLAARPRTCRADAMVVTRAMKASTIAELFVDEKGAAVHLEVGVVDLPAFRNLLPDKSYVALGHPSRPLNERMKDFFEHDFVIQTDSGERLDGQMTQMTVGRRVARDEITGEPLAAQPADAAKVIRFQLQYSWEQRPSSLTIQPRLVEVQGATTASIGFVLYHDGIPANDFRYLAAESTVELDWDDPWYSRFLHRNLQRQFKAPLSVYLYVDFFEVRKEIVIRPKDLQQWVDLGLEGRTVIEVDQQPELKRQAAEFLSGRGRVLIDGRAVEGRLDRIHFIRRTLRTTGVVDPPEQLDVNSATLGLIYSYPMTGLPEKVVVEWDLFGPKITSVPASAVDETGGLPTTLTPDSPELQWENYLKSPSNSQLVPVPPPRYSTVSVPLATALCFVAAVALAFLAARCKKLGSPFILLTALTGVGIVTGFLLLPAWRVAIRLPGTPAIASLDNEESESLVYALLFNVYRAFDHHNEAAVYDRLANSVSGDLLEEVYLQIRTSMELANQGGARVKVDDVRVEAAQALPQNEDKGLSFQCRWTATGSVGHWGHIHRRTNQYEAVITIANDDDRWRITHIELQQEKRIAPNAASGADAAGG